MTDAVLEMAKELVAEQIRARQVPPAEALSLLERTHATLLSLQRLESGEAPLAAAAPAATKNWKQSIKKHTIECLDCGKTFRQLSARHLRMHDLTPAAYRAKHGIPKTQPLASRESSAQRRALTQQIRPWERAQAKRTADKAPAKAPARRRGRPAAKA